MKERVIVAIDTSNYTTSLAILNENGELVANLKRPLCVKAGEVGLRQSDAVFAHIKNIPDIAKEAATLLADKEIIALGVSDKPRNIEGSYMPCFLSGVAAAESMAAALNVRLYKFSHQCGHIMAAVHSSGRHDLLCEDFAAFHISGGTTELIKVKPSGTEGFITELIGGTADLNAGQIIDRIGVLMGLPFPSGRYIEELALSNTSKIPRKKPSVKGLTANLSGLENMAEKLFSDTNDKSLVAAFVLKYIGNVLIGLCDNYIEMYGSTRFVFAGGVMCNSIIKKMLGERFDCVFAEPSMSADNAVGIAALALMAHGKNN